MKPQTRSLTIVSALAATFAFSVAGAHAQSNNTATGDHALGSNTTGDDNTADGYYALGTNDTGSSNTAVGRTALFRNTNGSFNTATGRDAMRANTTGGHNVANGHLALTSNLSGGYNVATGYLALTSHETGGANTAVGALALGESTTGNTNTAIGYLTARYNSGSFNTAIGGLALPRSSGEYNIAIGARAGDNLTSGSNNIVIGNEGVAGEARTIRIGNQEDHDRTFITGIFGGTVSNGVRVVVNPNGRLGTVVSSARFKEAIKPMEDASEALLRLQPVTFRYKPELDPDAIPQFGLVAEEVEKVNPDLVARDADGKVNTVRYDVIDAMLLNEFLKEHRKVQEQGAAIAQLKSSVAAHESAAAHLMDTVAKQEIALAEHQKTVADLTATLRAQAAKIQKVSAQVQVSQPTPEVALGAPSE